MKRLAVSLLMATTLVSPVFAQNIILAHGNPPGNPRSEGAVKFGELVNACSNGELTVTIADSASMGDDVELLTSTASGIIQMTANSQGATGQIIPEVNAIGLPFLFADAPSAWAVLDGEVGDLIKEKAEASGLKILNFWDNGIRHTSHVSKLIENPADLVGVKIRTPPDEMTLAIFNALGANPAPLAWSELPSALQSGVFEAQENPLSNTYTSKIHEITPFISLTGHKYESALLIANLGWYNGLSDTLKACVDQAALESTDYQRQLSLEAAETLMEPMRAEGVTFGELADRQAFIDATASVYEQYAQTMPELVEKLRASAAQ